MSGSARLHALVQVAHVARSRALSDALPEIAGIVGEAFGFAAAVVNLYRPAWDDLQVVAAYGSAEASEVLLWSTASRESWVELLDDRFASHGTYFVPHGQASETTEGAVFVPDLPRSSDPAAWHPEDLLLVPMYDSSGGLLAVLSVDEPVSGRRPSPSDSEALALAARFVGVAIEESANADRAARYLRASNELLKVSAKLNTGGSIDEVLVGVCGGIANALDFAKVAAFIREEDGWLRPRSSIGWDAEGGVPLREFEPSAVAPLLQPAFMREGCVLVDGATANRVAPASMPRVYTSKYNGTSPHAWKDHWLLVPLFHGEGDLTGVVWVDEPLDRLLPSRPRLQALRLFADQARTAIDAAGRLERMQQMAETDALTGLMNRRALRLAFAERCSGPAALLLIDLDHFKRINDQFGHAAGDEALVAFAELLSGVARPSDVAVRMGGEEFALVLPGADLNAGWRVAEQLRQATKRKSTAVGRRLTVSIGIAATAGGSEAACRQLLEDADAALYTAKRTGRDRSSAYENL